MFRLATSSLAKRGVSRSSTGARSWAVPSVSSSFHSSAPRQEEEKKDNAAVVEASSSGGGLSPLYAIPIGVAVAVPILEFQWFIPNEETLLASTFLGFCVIAYTQGGEMMANMFKEEANDILKAQNDAEENVISKLEEAVEYMKLTENIVEDYQNVMDLTETSYVKLNTSGAIKPQHLLKDQMEKILGMVATEENNAYEKAKITMMEDATAAVNARFTASKELKKAATTAAISKLMGNNAGGGGDPVQAQFVAYFAEQAKAAKASDDGSELSESRRTTLSKMNAIADNEEMYFRFDLDTGKPKLVL